MTPTGGDSTIDTCSICGADGDPRHLVAHWAYCTACGEAFDRDYEAYCREADGKEQVARDE